MPKLYIGVIIDFDDHGKEKPVIVQTSPTPTGFSTIMRGCQVHVLEVEVPPSMLTTHIEKQTVTSGGVGIKL